MNKTRIRFIAHCVAALVVIAIMVVTMGCSSTTTSTTPGSTVRLTSIAIQPDPTDNLALGSTRQFSALGTYSDGSNAEITDKVNWSVSDTSIASVSSSGLVTAAAIGNTGITATLLGLTSNTVKLTVIPAPALTSITISTAAPHNLGVSSTLQFIATGSYADGSTQDISSKVTWVSSDTTIVTITASGVATGLKVGTTDITAALSGITSPAVSIPVAAAALSSIAVTPSVPQYLGVGFNQQLTATGTYADGTTADLTSQVTWASSDSTIATISSSGLATGVAAGNTNITAELSGVTSTAVVLPVATLDSIFITPAAPAGIAIGATEIFKLVGTYSNGVQSLITGQGTWSSSNTAVATIATNGLATAVSAGTTDITVSYSGLTAKAVTLTVNAPTTTTTTTP